MLLYPYKINFIKKTLQRANRTPGAFAPSGFEVLISPQTDSLEQIFEFVFLKYNSYSKNQILKLFVLVSKTYPFPSVLLKKGNHHTRGFFPKTLVKFLYAPIS